MGLSLTAITDVCTLCELFDQVAIFDLKTGGIGECASRSEMLVSSSDHRKRKEADLPLDTPEQVRHSHEVDSALEHRAEREVREAVAQDAGFWLLARKIAFLAGLVTFFGAIVLCLVGDNHLLASAIACSGLAAMSGSINLGSTPTKKT